MTEESEVHYTAPTAFADLTLCDAGPRQRRTDPPCVSYRKVGDSGIFTRHPSRVYGHGAVKDGKECFEQVEKMVGPERMDELLETFFAKTLPAFPIFSAARLRSAYAARGSNPSDPTPYSVFSAIIPHVSTYIVDIRQLHKAAWGLCLDDMDDQYRQSRLNVVQLAVLLLVSRPALNTGQGTIATARAIGAAQLLGMHMDPSAWKLPAWERSVRKRLFWALLIHDKFRGEVLTLISLVERDAETFTRFSPAIWPTEQVRRRVVGALLRRPLTRSTLQPPLQHLQRADTHHGRRRRRLDGPRRGHAKLHRPLSTHQAP